MPEGIKELVYPILKEELIPALGCTEPIAIAYACAKAKEVLGAFPEKMTVRCSLFDNVSVSHSFFLSHHWRRTENGRS